MDDGASLDELKRRAYSSDGAEAVEARERLAVLELQREVDAAASAPATMELPAHTVMPRWFVVALGLAAAAAIAVGTVAVLSPRSSLDVFSRPQTTQDLAMPTHDAQGIASTERWIGASGGFEVYAYLRGLNEVCVVAVELNGSSWGCTTREDFNEIGFEMTTGRFTSTGTAYFRVQWGPYGRPHFANTMEER